MPAEAENLLSMMESRAEDGDLELRPDAYVYSSVINTWASSKSNNKAAKAWGIYERIKAQYAKGNVEAKPNEFIVSKCCVLLVYFITSCRLTNIFYR